MFQCLSDKIERGLQEWEKLPEKPIQAYVKIATRESSTLYLTWRARYPGKHPKNGTYILEVLGNELLYRARLDDEPDKYKPETLIPTLNKDGQCVFVINDKERELWEASRYILEPLLF
jgi:hypothetical protein